MHAIATQAYTRKTQSTIAYSIMVYCSNFSPIISLQFFLLVNMHINPIWVLSRECMYWWKTFHNILLRMDAVLHKAEFVKGVIDLMQPEVIGQIPCRIGYLWLYV